MAYFRCGGGGIPSSLKSGMNDVLNKKFGTSTTYAPATWPDNVNLLGPLPEKTVSGVVASFADGADDVPISDCKFYFNPKQAQGTPSPSNPLSISGWQGLTVYQTGKNLFDKNNPNVVTGYIDTNGFNTGNTNAKTVYIPIKSGETYTVSKNAGQRFWIATSPEIPTNGATYTNRKVGNTASSLYVTAGENDKYLWAWVFMNSIDTGTLEDMLASVQIELGSTATAYSAYKSKTPITVSLGRTVYGGYVTKDKVVATHIMQVYDGSNDEGWIYSSTNNVFYADIDIDYKKEANQIFHYCNLFEPVGQLTSAQGMSQNRPDKSVTLSSGSNNRIYLKYTDYTSASDFKTFLSQNNMQICMELATPIEYDITALNLSTYYGDNNFWSEGDTASVDYRADIALALGQ